LDGHGSRRACRDDDIDPALNKFGRERGITVIPPFRPAIFDCDVAAIDPAELAQPLQKSPDEWTPDRRRGRTQESNRGRLARLLRARREWPRRRAAKQGHDLAPLQLIEPHPLPQPGTPWQHIALARIELGLIAVWDFDSAHRRFGSKRRLQVV